MYDSTVTAQELVTSVSATVNVGCELSRDFYFGVLSKLEQLLYAEYICDERLLFAVSEDGEIDLSAAEVPLGERTPRSDDVFAVYYGEHPLRRVRLSEAYLLEPDEGEGYYYRSDEAKISLCLPPDPPPEDVAVFYRAAPRIKLGESVTDSVALPYEFLPLAEAKLRGEAYKLADDDASAAKWLAEYNSLLSSFSEWLARAEKGRS